MDGTSSDHESKASTSVAKNVTLAIAGVIIIVVIALLAQAHARKNEAATDAQNASGAQAVQSTDASQAATDQDAGSGAQALITKPATATSSKKMDYTQATLHTNLGDIVISFDKTNTPKTVENFIKLASTGFYNGTKFHRVIAGFMVQGGDPNSKDDTQMSSWGKGGPGYQFADEITPSNSNVKGTIAMANAGPNTNGSQFFINVADNEHLNTKHTVFGHVTAGYDIVEKISHVKTNQDNRPLEAVTITSVDLK